MKTYQQFVSEAYVAHQELHEVIGAAKRFGARVIPGLQTAYGLGLGTYRLTKGDIPGAALGYAQAVPGPIGWAALAADVGRDLISKPGAPKVKPTAPKTTAKPSPSPSGTAKPAPTPVSQKPVSQTVLAKKDGVEGRLDKKTGKFETGTFSSPERKKYETTRGAEQIKKDAEKLRTRSDSEVARSGYAGQKVSPIKLEKPVSLRTNNPFVS